MPSTPLHTLRQQVPIPLTGLDVIAARALGINNGDAKHAGRVARTAAEDTASTSYVYLASPDRVDDIEVVSGMVVELAYFAEWGEEAANNGRAAIFCDRLTGGPGTSVVASEQLRTYDPDSDSWSQIEAKTSNEGGDLTKSNLLLTGDFGLGSTNKTAISARPTTGLVWGTSYKVRWKVLGSGMEHTDSAGGPCRLRDLAPGTYNFGIKFRTAQSGKAIRRHRGELVVVAFKPDLP